MWTRTCNSIVIMYVIHGRTLRSYLGVGDTEDSLHKALMQGLLQRPDSKLAILLSTLHWPVATTNLLQTGTY